MESVFFFCPPHLRFPQLDEPTSGLDARSALLVVKTLRTIVKAKQKVLCAERLALLKETDDCVLLRLKSLAASRCWAKFKMFYTRCVGIKNEEQILALFLDVDSVRSGASFDLDALFMSTLSLCK